MRRAELEVELNALPVSEKARLVDLLLASIDADDSEDVDRAWANECKDRMDAFARGEIHALDGEGVVENLKRRYNG